MSDQPRSDRRKRSRTILVSAIVAGLAVLVAVAVQFHVGFIEITELEYTPFVRKLDDRNELSITTYPSGFPRETSAIPFVNKKMVTDDKVYFQVFVRERGKPSGPNPHVKSIRIHSFAYRLGNEPPTELISGFDSNFWMQGNSRYDKQGRPAIPYEPDATLFVEISFTLNGTTHSYQGEMQPVEKSSYAPLFLELLR